MSSERSRVGWIVALALSILGATLVWKQYNTSTALRQRERELQHLRAAAAREADTDTKGRVNADPSAKERLRSLKSEAPSSARASAARFQVDTLKWIKLRRMGPLTVPFLPIDAGNTFSLQLAIMLGLTEDEYDRLNAAIQETKLRCDDLAIQSATSHLSKDGKTLEVTVPSLAAGGDTLYSGLLDEFTQVLGPERYQLFNALAGDAFDASFDRFGLNSVTYRLTVQSPEQDDAPSKYSVTRNYIDANGKNGGANTGTFSSSDLKKIYPVLAHFLRPDLGKESVPATAR